MNCLQCSKQIAKAYCSACMQSAAVEAETAIDEAQWDVDQTESIRLDDMEHAAFALGTPDIFSDEMRWFWKAES